MKARATGGTGFIDSHVVDVLVQYGHSVRLFSGYDRLVFAKEKYALTRREKESGKNAETANVLNAKHFCTNQKTSFY